MKNEERIAIVEGLRTPFAGKNGGLKDVDVPELARFVLRSLMDRLNLSENELDEVLLASAFSSGDSHSVAALSCRLTGLTPKTSSMMINRGAASGLEAVRVAYERLLRGEITKTAVIGADSASKNLPRESLTAGHLSNRLTDEGGENSSFMLGEVLEETAREWEVGREEQDRYALRSHRAATMAREKIAGEIAPYPVPLDYTAFLKTDALPREGAVLGDFSQHESLFELQDDPVEGLGSLTERNTALFADGAAALILAREKILKEREWKPLGTIQSACSTAFDPRHQGLGAAYAIPLLLRRAGCQLNDVDLFELDESSAAGVLASLKALNSRQFARRELGWIDPVGEIPPEKLNVNGGALALGAPPAATGLRMILNLLQELKLQNKRRGIVVMESGDGQAVGFMLERDEDGEAKK